MTDSTDPSDSPGAQRFRSRLWPSYYGWRMVAVAFFVDFIAVGFFFYSYGVFFKAIAQEFGDSRFGVSIGIMLTQIAGAVVAPIIGQALDRYPLRKRSGAWRNHHGTWVSGPGAGTDSTTVLFGSRFVYWLRRRCYGSACNL